MLGARIASCFENKGFSGCCQTDECRNNIEVLVNPEDARTGSESFSPDRFQTEAKLILSKHVAPKEGRSSDHVRQGRSKDPYGREMNNHASYDGGSLSPDPAARTPNGVPQLSLNRLLEDPNAASTRETTGFSFASGGQAPHQESICGFNGDWEGRGAHSFMRGSSSKPPQPGSAAAQSSHNGSRGEFGHPGFGGQDPRQNGSSMQYGMDDSHQFHGDRQPYNQTYGDGHLGGPNIMDVHRTGGAARQSEIEDMRNMIAALQSRLIKAETLAKHHEGHMSQLLQMQGDGGMKSTQTDRLQAETRAQVAEDQVVMLGLRLKQLEHETEDMRSHLFHSEKQLQEMKEDTVNAPPSRQQETFICAGPRRACG